MNKFSVSTLRGRFPEITDRELFVYHHVLSYEERTKYLKTGKMPTNGLRAHIIQDLDVLLAGGSFEGAGSGQEKAENVVSPEAEKSEQDRVADGAGKHTGRRHKNRRRHRKK